MKNVSLVCPVYNSIDYLPELIMSVISQDFDDFECILVDDCSTDGSFEYINELSDNRFTVIRNNKNQGAQKSRRVGLSASTGEYVCFIDCDDVLRSDYISKLYENVNSEKSEIAICNYSIINAQGEITRSNNNVTPIDRKYFPTNANIYPTIIMSKPAYWNKIFLTSFVVKNINFIQTRLGQDVGTVIPLLAKSKKISYVEEELYYYRVRGKSISSTVDESIADILIPLGHIGNTINGFKEEIEFIVVGHIFYQITKTLLINDKQKSKLLYSILYNYLNEQYPYWRKNKYYIKRFDYRIYCFILSKRWLFYNFIVKAIYKYTYKSKLANNLIRKLSDK